MKLPIEITSLIIVSNSLIIVYNSQSHLRADMVTQRWYCIWIEKIKRKDKFTTVRWRRKVGVMDWYE